MTHKPTSSPPPSLGRHAVSGAIWITGEMIFVQGLSLFVFALLARYLTPSDFGVAAISFVVIHSCKNILFDNTAAVVTRKAAATDVEYSTAFWMILAAACAIVIVLQGISFAADWLFGAPGLGAVMRVMSAILLLQGFSRMQEAWMMRHFRFRALALRSITGALAGAAAGIAGANLGFGVWALVAQQVVASLGGLVLLWIACPWRPSRKFSRDSALEIARFSRSIIGGSIAYAFNQSCDTLLIGIVFGPASVGIYNIAKRLRLALQLVAATPVNGITTPILAEAQADPARFNRSVLTATAAIAAVCAPSFLGAAAIGRDTIALVFGPQWIAAAPIFAWLALGALLAILMECNNTVFVIRNCPKWTLYMAMFNVIATLVTFLALQTGRGETVALPFVIPQILALPISVALLCKVTGIRPRAWTSAAGPPLAAAALMAFCIRMADPMLSALPASLRLAILIAGGAILYGALLMLVSRALVADLKRFVHARRP